MKTQYKQIIYSTIFALTLSACGGGGGGGGAAGISYTGSTSQASLTIGNGEEISTIAYQNGGTGQGLGTVLSSLAGVEPAQPNNSPKTAALAKILAGTINKIQLSTDVVTNSRAMRTDSGSFTGNCSNGTASYSISFDDVSGDFSGSFSFSNYCDLGDTINGSLSFSGNIDVNSLTFGTMTMTMSSLSISSGNDSFTADGSMSFNPSSSPIAATMNMKLKDNTTQQVFWVDDFSLTILETINYEELSMAGRFYHPDYGYVEITTTTPFRYTGLDEYPYPGVMVATGSNGGTTTLTSLSNTSYRVDIDEDGDGNLEQTTTGNWNSL